MSRPMWVVYEVRSKSCRRRSEDDLDLLDRAAVALEPVVDPAADEPSAELGERPMELGALADRAARCWIATESGPVPGDRPPRASRPAPSVTSIVPVSSDWRPRRHPTDGTSSSTSEASAPSPKGRASASQRAVRRARDPADGDRLLEVDAGGDVEDDALGPQRPGQLGELVVGRQARSRRRVVALAGEEVGDRLNRRRRSIGAGERPPISRPSPIDQPGASGGNGRASDALAVGAQMDRRAFQRSRPQVDVGRVEAVRLWPAAAAASISAPTTPRRSSSSSGTTPRRRPGAASSRAAASPPG